MADSTSIPTPTSTSTTEFSLHKTATKKSSIIKAVIAIEGKDQAEAEKGFGMVFNVIMKELDSRSKSNACKSLKSSKPPISQRTLDLAQVSEIKIPADFLAYSTFNLNIFDTKVLWSVIYDIIYKKQENPLIIEHIGRNLSLEGNLGWMMESLKSCFAMDMFCVLISTFSKVNDRLKSYIKNGIPDCTFIDYLIEGEVGNVIDFLLINEEFMTTCLDLPNIVSIISKCKYSTIKLLLRNIKGLLESKDTTNCKDVLALMITARDDNKLLSSSEKTLFFMEVDAIRKAREINVV